MKKNARVYTSLQITCPMASSSTLAVENNLSHESLSYQYHGGQKLQEVTTNLHGG